MISNNTEVTSVETKYCWACKTSKPFSDFYHIGINNDTLERYCKSCTDHRRSKLYDGNWKRAIEQTEGKCALCGEEYQHIHHVIPRSHGGSDDLGNLVALCHDCHLKAHNGAFSNINGLNDEIFLKLNMRYTNTKYLNVIDVLNESITILKQNLRNEQKTDSHPGYLDNLSAEIYEFEQAIQLLAHQEVPK